MKSCLAMIFTLLLPLAGVAQNSNFGGFPDADQDRLDDRFEQQLLIKFLPTFFISSHDCDGTPSEFVSGNSNPLLLAKNGSIYGQVFPHRNHVSGSAVLEIHYYHLWNRDCGRLGHALDPEHVSTLIRADHFEQSPDAWKAVYWYAAAHEDTLCDVSQAARAGVLHASDRGATIWISQGKHASFLSESKCRLGCGENRCEEMKALEPSNPINIGELGFPMNGASWAQSDSWTLKTKMRSDFTSALVARLDESEDELISVNTPPPPTQALLLTGNSSFGALVTSNDSTEKALSIGGSRSIRATGKAIAVTGKSLRRVGRKLIRIAKPR